MLLSVSGGIASVAASASATDPDADAVSVGRSGGGHQTRPKQPLSQAIDSAKLRWVVLASSPPASAAVAAADAAAALGGDAGLGGAGVALLPRVQCEQGGRRRLCPQLSGCEGGASIQACLAPGFVDALDGGDSGGESYGSAGAKHGGIAGAAGRVPGEDSEGNFMDDADAGDADPALPPGDECGILRTVFAGAVELPGCQQQQQQAEGGSHAEWAGEVYVLHNVFVNAWGAVFNSTHLFLPGEGCFSDRLSSPSLRRIFQFKYGKGPRTHVTEHELVANVAVLPLRKDAAGEPGLLEEMVERLPLLLLLSQVLPAVAAAGELKQLQFMLGGGGGGGALGPIVASGGRHRMLRWVSTHIVGAHPLQQPLRLAPDGLAFVRTLIQPVHEVCGRASPSMWRTLRNALVPTAAVQSSGRKQQQKAPPQLQMSLPLFHPDWSPNSPALSLPAAAAKAAAAAAEGGGGEGGGAGKGKLPLSSLPPLPPPLPPIPDWVVVVAVAPESENVVVTLDGTYASYLREMSSQVEVIVGGRFWFDRVVVIDGRMGHSEATNVMRRALLLVLASGRDEPSPAAALIPFMPPESYVIELKAWSALQSQQQQQQHQEAEGPQINSFVSSSSSSSTARSSLVQSLTTACGLSYVGVVCMWDSSELPSTLDRESGASAGTDKASAKGIDQGIQNPGSQGGSSGGDGSRAGGQGAVGGEPGGSEADASDIWGRRSWLTCSRSAIAVALDWVEPRVFEHVSMPRSEFHRSLRRHIPGSGFDHTSAPDSTERFRRWSECVSTRGRWMWDPQVRRLPWDFRGVGTMCENEFKAKEPMAVNGPKADKVAVRYVESAARGDHEGMRAAEEAWKVRDHVKLFWQVPDVAGCEALYEEGSSSVGSSLLQGAMGMSSLSASSLSSASPSSSSSASTSEGGLLTSQGLAFPPSPSTIPSSSWVPWSAEGFCQTVGPGFRILIIGDSKQYQLVETLVNNLVLPINKPTVPNHVDVVPKVDDCVQWLGEPNVVKNEFCTLHRVHNVSYCPGGVTIDYIRHDLLRLRVDSDPPRFVRMPWALLLEQRRRRGEEPDVVIVNAGVHYVPIREFKRHIGSSLMYLRKMFPDKLLIFRATPPGHANCKDIEGSSPLKQRQRPEELWFDWAKLAEQNAAAKRIAERLGVVFMDVDYMTALRPDSHRGMNWRGKMDCLHYCFPGPVDTWAQLLYNVLVKLNFKPKRQ